MQIDVSVYRVSSDTMMLDRPGTGLISNQASDMKKPERNKL